MAITLLDHDAHAYLGRGDLEPVTVRFRKLFLEREYATRFSMPGFKRPVGVAIGGQAGSPHPWRDALKIQVTKVCAHQLRALGLPSRSLLQVAVYSLKPMSKEAAAQCVIDDLYRLSSSEREELCPGAAVLPERKPDVTTAGVSLLTADQAKQSRRRLPSNYLSRAKASTSFYSRLRVFFAENGYATRYSMGYCSQTMLPDVSCALGGGTGGSLAGLLLSDCVPQADILAALPAGSRFVRPCAGVTVYSLCDLSLEAAVHCVVQDIMKLSLQDRDRVVVIGNGVAPTKPSRPIKSAVTALPSPELAPLPGLPSGVPDPVSVDDITAQCQRSESAYRTLSSIDQIRIYVTAGAQHNSAAFWSRHLNDVMKNLDQVAAYIAST